MKIFILFFFMYMITATHYVVAQDSLYVCQYGASINQGAISDIDSITFSKEFGGLQDTMYVFRSGIIAEKRALSDIDSIIFHSLGPVAKSGDSVTDIDGNAYGTLQLGLQLWMTGNLKVTHYINGNEIPLAINNDVWDNPSPAY